MGNTNEKSADLNELQKKLNKKCECQHVHYY